MDNSVMHRLRHARFLARLVLEWFALASGVAIASPIVKPQALELVCSSAGGIRLVASGADGDVAPAGHVLDCPMCTPTGAPPPAACLPGPAALPRSRAVQSIPAARIAALIAAPLPARGPPSSPAVR
jgi:hypothetical protein